MSSREDTASSEAQPHACPRLCTPLEGLRAWDRLGGFSYAFLDDTTRRELARLDARALARRVALARDGLLELLREQDIRASPWTEDVVRHASDVSHANESAPSESPATTKKPRAKPTRGQAVVVLAFPPGLDFLVAFLACDACAAVAVPVRPPDPTGAAERFAEERMALIGVATASDARLTLTTRAYAAAFAVADVKRKVFATLRAKKKNVASDTAEKIALPFAFVPLERLERPRKRRTDSSPARVGSTPRVGDKVEKNAKNKKQGVVAFVQFTSGSTGAPKGVVVGASHLTTNCALIRARLGVTDEDSNVSWLPQFHDMGLVGAWLVPLTIPGDRGEPTSRVSVSAGVAPKDGPVGEKNKAVGVFYSPAAFARDPASWMRVASEYRATMTQGPDFAYRLCAMRFRSVCHTNENALNLSRLRSCLNASERAQPDTHELFASTFVSHGWNPASMRAGYGLAESVVYVCDGPVRVAQIHRRALEETNEAVECATFDVREKDNLDDLTTSVRVSSCGAVRVGSGDGEISAQISALDPDVRVVCPETRAELPDGRVGEIWVRGGSVAFGYVDKDGFSLGAAFGREISLLNGTETHAETETKKKKKSKRVLGGYLRTGDSGFIDGVSGEVFVVGRMRDRFKVNGRAYSPEDIERVILDAKPGVFRRGGVAAFAFEEASEKSPTDPSRYSQKSKNAVAFCTPATRVGVVAEIRDEFLNHDPVAYARLLDDVREVVCVTHGLRLRRRDVAIVRAGAAPKTSSGKKRRDETRRLFLNGFFFTRGVAAEGFATLFAEDGDFFAENDRFGSMFLFHETRLDHETSVAREQKESLSRSDSETEIGAKTFLQRLARRRGARFAARHVETCLRRFLATEPSFRARAGAVDSFAAVRLTARLEFELGVSIPPTLVLLNASKPEKLARALLRAAISDEETEEDEDAAPDAAPDVVFSTPAERVRLSSSLGAPERETRVRREVSFDGTDGTDGTDAAKKTTVFGDRPIVRAIPGLLILPALALALAPATRREPRTPRVAFFFNQADEKEMAAHARFFEWRARVAPAQIVIGVLMWVLGRTVRRFSVSGDKIFFARDVERRVAFFAASANAFLTHGALGLAFASAHVGARFFCEKALAKVLSTKNTRQSESETSPSRKTRKTRVAIAWALCLAELVLLNASEAWTVGDSFARNTKRRDGGKEASRLTLFLARGALAGSTFTPTRAARYVAVRLLDRSLDRIEKGLDTNADAFADAFAFAAQPATFQCGPLVPHAAYAEKSEKSVSKKKKKKTRVSFGFIFLRRLRRLLSSLVPLASWCLLVDLMYAVGYRPTSTFFSPRRNVNVNAQSSASGFSELAQTVCFATASWITSHAVFGVPRAVAIAFDDTVGDADDAFLHRGGCSDDDDDDDDDDVSTVRTAHVVPHDTPCFWPSASTTPATFWRRFHASFFTFYFARCFAPMRGGYGGIVVSVAVSTAFHGFQTKWLLWGGITAFGLVAEKWARGRARFRERRREEKKDASRFAFRTTLRAALAQTATVATFVGPATFPGLGERAAAKVLTWGILISAVWQNAERVQRVAQKARA